MKKIITLCFFTLCLVLQGLAQDRQAIIKVMETSRLAWNKAELETFMECYWESDSVMFVGQSGPTFGYQNTLKNYKQTYGTKTGMGTLTYAIKKIEIINKDNAFVYGGWKLNRKNDKLSGYYTLWFKRIKGLWKIVVDHSS